MNELELIENALNVANEKGVWDLKTAYRLQHAVGVVRTKLMAYEGPPDQKPPQGEKPGPSNTKTPLHKGN